MLPRERCLSHGPSTLSLRECLALVLGSGPPGKGALGLAEDILNIAGDGLDRRDAERAFLTAMEVAPDSHLSHITGIGDASRARLMAAFELGRRYACYRAGKRRAPAEDGSLRDLALRKVPEARRHAAQEWLGFVPQYRGGELGGLCIVENGVRTHVNVEPAELFARLLAPRPRAFYLFHNHPSGELIPSPQDIELTLRVRKLADSFEIRLLGHGIVSPRGEHWIVL